MSVTKEEKAKTIEEFQGGKHDTGSVEVQVALLTQRIEGLSDHFKNNMKDHHSRYGLIKMIGQRKKLLSYLNRVDEDRYKKLITRLGLRK